MEPQKGFSEIRKEETKEKREEGSGLRYWLAVVLRGRSMESIFSDLLLKERCVNDSLVFCSVLLCQRTGPKDKTQDYRGPSVAEDMETIMPFLYLFLSGGLCYIEGQQSYHRKEDLEKWRMEGLHMNSMKLVIPLPSLYWSVHTKDESKRETAFAFIFGVN